MHHANSYILDDAYVHSIDDRRTFWKVVAMGTVVSGCRS